MLQGGFNFHKWNSNDPAVLNAINEAEDKGHAITGITGEANNF